MVHPGVLCSYPAHATFITSKSRDLSADYPGELVRQLESDSAIDFSLYAAGAVGSHSPNKPAPFSYNKLQEYAQQLADPILHELPTLAYDSAGYWGLPTFRFLAGKRSYGLQKTGEYARTGFGSHGSDEANPHFSANR